LAPRGVYNLLAILCNKAIHDRRLAQVAGRYSPISPKVTVAPRLTLVGGLGLDYSLSHKTMDGQRSGSAQANRGMRYMPPNRLPWEDNYQFVGPNITADGVRINYPFDPTFPADVRFVIGSGRHLVRPNRHEHYEIAYLYSGSMEVQIRDRRFHLKKGDVVVIGPNIYKQFLYNPRVESRLITLNFRPEVIRSGAAEGEEEIYLSSFLYQGPRFPHVISGDRALSREAFQLLLKIHNELPARTVLDRLAAKTYLRVLFLLLARRFRGCLETHETMDRKLQDMDRLRPVFDFLGERCGEHIEVKDAARVCAMSASYFMRFFKQTTGQSFRAYLTGFRIEKAQLMLASGETSIAEIGQRVGFCSQSYFGEVFRALVGMTPRAFRRRFRKRLSRALQMPVKPATPARTPESVSRGQGGFHLPRLRKGPASAE